MPQSYDPPDVWKPFGSFSQAVIGGTGRVIYVKGQVPLDADGALVGEDDMGAQVAQVHANIRTILTAFGGRMEDVVSLTQYTTDIEAFMQTGAIRQRYFTAPFPVTTTVEVARLFRRDILVEITAIAEIPEDRFLDPTGD